jgi:hypothetical protein
MRILESSFVEENVISGAKILIIGPDSCSDLARVVLGQVQKVMRDPKIGLYRDVEDVGEVQVVPVRNDVVDEKQGGQIRWECRVFWKKQRPQSSKSTPVGSDGIFVPDRCFLSAVRSPGSGTVKSRAICYDGCVVFLVPSGGGSACTDLNQSVDFFEVYTFGEEDHENYRWASW